MSRIAIKVENLSKMYRIGEIGTGTLSHDLHRWWAKVRGKEDPLMKLGEVNDQTSKSGSNVTWSLKNVGFEIEQGTTVGIVGKNGAGKSTLLKILSKVTSPTTGAIRCKGRVASLLEVGTGFHPELTGRENIYLNGAILGMRKREIARRFDEIVSFAGIERYVDTPVKRYSSGMYVRLAFAVAAHLESEILIVDEVLAVGDAEFQKKCLGKMKDVSNNEGRTVLFVSHNMIAIKSLCQYGMFLSNGSLHSTGPMADIVDAYIATSALSSTNELSVEANDFIVHSIQATNNGVDGYFDINQNLEFRVTVTAKRNFSSINVNLFFNASEGGLIFATCSNPEPLQEGRLVYQCCIPANTLNDNIYSIELMVVEDSHKSVHHLSDVLTLQGIEPKRNSSWLGKFPGLIRPTFTWQKIEN